MYDRGMRKIREARDSKALSGDVSNLREEFSKMRDSMTSHKEQFYEKLSNVEQSLKAHERDIEKLKGEEEEEVKERIPEMQKQEKERNKRADQLFKEQQEKMKEFPGEYHREVAKLKSMTQEPPKENEVTTVHWVIIVERSEDMCLSWKKIEELLTELCKRRSTSQCNDKITMVSYDHEESRQVLLDASWEDVRNKKAFEWDVSWTLLRDKPACPLLAWNWLEKNIEKVLSSRKDDTVVIHASTRQGYEWTFGQWDPLKQATSIAKKLYTAATAQTGSCFGFLFVIPAQWENQLDMSHLVEAMNGGKPHCIDAKNHILQFEHSRYSSGDVKEVIGRIAQLSSKRLRAAEEDFEMEQGRLKCARLMHEHRKQVQDETAHQLEYITEEMQRCDSKRSQTSDIPCASQLAIEIIENKCEFLCRDKDRVLGQQNGDAEKLKVVKDKIIERTCELAKQVAKQIVILSSEDEELHNQIKESWKNMKHQFHMFESVIVYKLLVQFLEHIQNNVIQVDEILESFEEAATPLSHMIRELEARMGGGRMAISLDDFCQDTSAMNQEESQQMSTVLSHSRGDV